MSGSRGCRTTFACLLARPCTCRTVRAAIPLSSRLYGTVDARRPAPSCESRTVVARLLARSRRARPGGVRLRVASRAGGRAGPSSRLRSCDLSDSLDGCEEGGPPSHDSGSTGTLSHGSLAHRDSQSRFFGPPCRSVTVLGTPCRPDTLLAPSGCSAPMICAPNRTGRPRGIGHSSVREPPPRRLAQVAVEQQTVNAVPACPTLVRTSAVATPPRTIPWGVRSMTSHACADDPSLEGESRGDPMAPLISSWARKVRPVVFLAGATKTGWRSSSSSSRGGAGYCRSGRGPTTRYRRER